MGMTLDIQGEQQMLDPSPAQIETTIKTMSLRDGSFLILDSGGDGLTYIQAAREDSSVWTVEYQDGSLDQHFQAANVDTEKVVTMFLAFAGGDKAWRRAVTWTKIEI